MRPTYCEELEFLSTYSDILVFFFILVSIVSLIPYISDSSLFHFHIHCYHARIFICVIAVIMIYYSRFL